MGLDMYINRKTRLRTHEMYNENTRQKITITNRKTGRVDKSIDASKIDAIISEDMYWRKANAIHKWFVDNIQDGNDNCLEYFIPEDQLQELYDIVKKVLDSSELVVDGTYKANTFRDGKIIEIEMDNKVIKDPTVAKELLPSSSGFFFGSTDYNEYYLQDIQATKDWLDKVFIDDEKYLEDDYYYNSSW